MRQILFALLLFANVDLSFAQAIVYDPNVEVRPVAAFSAIEVSGSMNVFLSQGSPAGLAVSAADQKYNSKIKTEVTNGVLHISVDGGMWNTFGLGNQKLKAYVTATNVSSLTVSGASMINISENLKSDALKLDVSGASEIKGSINVGKLNLSISGASVARLNGTANEGSIDGSGASKVISYDLKFETCRASSSGASVLRFTVDKALNADASGGSAIDYRGNPNAVKSNAGTGASIKKRN